jgi:hypothetical protein
VAGGVEQLHDAQSSRSARPGVVSLLCLQLASLFSSSLSYCRVSIDGSWW